MNQQQQNHCPITDSSAIGTYRIYDQRMPRYSSISAKSHQYIHSSHIYGSQLCTKYKTSESTRNLSMILIPKSCALAQLNVQLNHGYTLNQRYKWSPYIFASSFNYIKIHGIVSANYVITSCTYKDRGNVPSFLKSHHLL